MERARDIQEKFGARVRQLHVQAGDSPEGFAHECGLDRTYIGGIERGERNVSLANIEKIAVALGIPISELFKNV